MRLRLSAPNDGLRWSTPEQWHITLHFYGEVDAVVANCLRAALLETDLVLPGIAMEELGLFAAKGILFATVTSSLALVQLHQAVSTRSQLCGIRPESRSFRPHVTLARSKSRAGHKTLQKLSTPQLPSFGAPLTWTATELLLVRSELHPQGAQYSEFCRVPMGSPKAQPVTAA